MDEKRDITWSCVYLMAIHHVGGNTYQPELHIDMSPKPPLFPALSQTAQHARRAGMVVPPCICTPARKDEETGMHVLPQRPPVVRKTILAQWPTGTFRSVFFGKSEPLSVLMLDGTSADKLQEQVPNALEKPFEGSYNEAFDRIKVKVHVRIRYPIHAAPR